MIGIINDGQQTIGATKLHWSRLRAKFYIILVEIKISHS